MRDAMGGVVNITFIAIFMLVVSGYLAFSVSYNKAFKVKNKIISALEQYEGYNEGSIAAIDEYMKQIGYNVPNNVIEEDDDYASNSSTMTQYDPTCKYQCKNGYCVKWFPERDSENAGIPKGYYHVVAMVDIDVPIFNKFLPFMEFFKTSGDTMTINSTNSCPK